MVIDVGVRFCGRKGRIFIDLVTAPTTITEMKEMHVKKQILLTMASTAVFLTASAALAGGLKLDANTEVFQYGDSMYTWDLESGGAVRVGAIWDGFMPQDALYQQGDFVYRRSALSGEAVKVGAVWDGHVAGSTAVASARKIGGATLALKR